MYKQAIEIWYTFYKFHTKETYTMDGQQGKHLKQLLKKIESKVKEKGMEPTEENILNSLKGFLSMVKDTWILEHLEISLINSKFNSLYVGAIKNSPFQNAQRIDDIVESRFGSKKAADN